MSAYRWIDHPLAVRQEGDAAIIPVAEDVRVTKQPITRHELQNAALRRQNVALERLPGPGDNKLN